MSDVLYEAQIDLTPVRTRKIALIGYGHDCRIQSRARLR